MSRSTRVFLFLAAAVGALGVSTAFTHRVAAESKFDTQVKYDRATPLPPAEFVPLSTVEIESIAAPQTCLDGTGEIQFKINSAYRKDKLTKWKQETQCTLGITKATPLKKEIDDLEEGIAVITNVIQSLAFSQSKQELGAVTALTGNALFTVPAGEKQERAYPRVDGIAFQCVQGVQAWLGESDLSKLAVFAVDVGKITGQLSNARQQNKDTHLTYTTLLKKGVSNGTKEMALNQLTALKKSLGNAFVAVSQGALSTYHKSSESSNNFLKSSVSIKVGERGEKYPCETPRTFGGFAGAWVEGTIIIDGLSYENACVPEAHIIVKTKEGFAENIAFLQGERAKYEKLLAPLEKQLAALKTKNYNCTVSAAVPVQVAQTTGSQPVRKSTMPNTPLSGASDPELSTLAPGQLPKETSDFLSSSPTVRPAPSRIAKKSTLPTRTPPADTNEGPEIVISSYSYSYSEETVPNDPTKADERNRVSVQRTWDATGGKEHVVITMPHKTLSRWYDVERDTTWPAEAWPPSKDGAMKQRIITRTDRKESDSTVGAFVPGPLFNHFLWQNDNLGRYNLHASSASKVKGSVMSVSETLDTKVKLLFHGDPAKTYEISLGASGARPSMDDEENMYVHTPSWGTLGSLYDKDFTIAGQQYNPVDALPGIRVRGKGGSEVDVTPVTSSNYVYSLHISRVKEIDEAKEKREAEEKALLGSVYLDVAGTTENYHQTIPEADDGKWNIYLTWTVANNAVSYCTANWTTDRFDLKNARSGYVKVPSSGGRSIVLYEMSCFDATGKLLGVSKMKIHGTKAAADQPASLPIIKPPSSDTSLTSPQSPLSPLIQELRERVKELEAELRERVKALEADRDRFKGQLEVIRRQRNYSPPPAAEQLNATPQPTPYAAEPLRRQLGDIAETLSSMLEWLDRAVR